MKSLIDEWKYVVGSKYIRLIFIGPMIAALFFGLMFSQNQLSKSPVVVIDEDHSEYSRQLISKINASQYMSVESVYASRMSTETLLANEQAVAVIMLPNQLGIRQQQGKSTNIGILMDNTMPSGLTGIRTAVQEIIQTENMTLSMTRLIQKGMAAETAKGIVSPLSLQQRMLFNPTSSYVGFMVLGFVNIVVLMITTSAAGLNCTPASSGRETVCQRKVTFPAMGSECTLRCVEFPFAASILWIVKAGGGMRFEAEPYLFIIPLVVYAFALSLMGMLIGYTAKDMSKVSLRTSFVLYPSFWLREFN
ncbi:ABC transporter permease [Paenibacillus amylolyticus]|nr:ABC transporter permease [Paenibacillus amylolyticus]